MNRRDLFLGIGAGAVICALVLSKKKAAAAAQFPNPGTSFRFSVDTANRKMAIIVPVTTSTMQQIRLKAWDYDNPKTFLTNRFMKFEGTKEFIVLLPLTPKRIMMTLEAEGTNIPFSIGIIRKEPLPQRLDMLNLGANGLGTFINFAENFAFNASYLDTGKTYRSDDKRFFIEYIDVIKDSAGNALNTSARINEETGTMQVSKRDFSRYTVAGRMAVLLHEYSHFWLNRNPDDESEADLNGLLVYLALGFPRVEAFEVWADVFHGANTAANQQRFKLIADFVEKFEKNQLT